MKLYHGSNKIVKSPQFGYGKKQNDYGLGFYCTKELDLAREWAVLAERDGYVNEYDVNTTGLSVLDLNSDSYCILEWLGILLENRTFDINSDFGEEAVNYIKDYYSVDYKSYDIIKGYRADDSYFSFAQDFLSNNISLNTLKQAMTLGMLGEQIVLKSKKSFERIKYINSSPAEAKIWFPKKEYRDQKARSDYRLLRKRPREKGDLYMMQIIDMEIKKDDPRLR